MIKKRTLAALFLSFLFILISLSLTACDLISQPDALSAGGGENRVIIQYPADGAQLYAGEMVDVTSFVSLASGGESLSLTVNNEMYRHDTFVASFGSGDVYQPWTPPGPGEYILQVIAASTSGETFASDPITVYVGKQLTVVSVTPTITTATLTPTPTPTEIITITFTPIITVITPEEQASATANQNLNCRFGPGYAYEALDGFWEGETAPVIGVNEQGDWLLIEATHLTIECWIPAEHVSLSQDVSGYTIYPAPPLPITDTPTLVTPTFTPTFTPTLTTRTLTPTLITPTLITPVVITPSDTPDGPTTP